MSGCCKNVKALLKTGAHENTKTGPALPQNTFAKAIAAYTTIILSSPSYTIATQAIPSHAPPDIPINIQLLHCVYRI